MIRFIGKLFSKNKTKKLNFPDEPNIIFGRYVDQNKTEEQYDCWDKSKNLYKEKKYLDAFIEFFNYLKDSSIDNVSFELEETKINFTLIQGSKTVTGTINETEVLAEAELVRFDKLEVPVMRKLLQENYYLNFSKFAIKNDIYTLKYFSPIEDAHPSSLYYALKELAIEADMYDDVLVDEFDSLKAINTDHVEDISEHEKRIKLKFFKKWIEETLDRIKELDSDKFTGSISYNLLNLAFKIYYLLAPEGKLLDDIGNLQGMFYENDDSTINEKNHRMIEEFESFKQKSDDEILKSFYRIKATFGVVKPTSHENVTNFMQDELEKVKYYVENKHPEIVRQMCEYIISYAGYSFGMPSIANDILLIAWRVLNPELFMELGFTQKLYDQKSKKFNTEAIKKKINTLVGHSKKRHSNIDFNVNNLDFSSINDFAISFIDEFRNLKYNL